MYVDFVYDAELKYNKLEQIGFVERQENWWGVGGGA